MSALPVPARPAVLGALSAAVVLGLLVSGVPGSASAVEPVEPPEVNCPASVGAVDYPLASPRIAESSVAVEIIAGALPKGLRLDPGPEGWFVTGKPEVAGVSTVALQGVVMKPDGTKTTGEAICTIEVRSAPKVTRIAGADRFAQSVAVAEGFFESAETVFVASGEKFPDALSATAIAAANKAPLLLTTAASMPAEVLAEIVKLAPKNVVVVGGSLAISDAVVAQIDAASTATITRVGGADRFEVSRNLITHPVFGLKSSKRIHLATGTNFPDALTASPPAAVAGAPVLLVNGSATSLSAAESAVVTGLGAKEAVISGGPLSISTALEKSVATTLTVTRFAGSDRYDTGIQTNAGSFHEARTMFLASGSAFPDALSGGVVAGIGGSPLYVTQSCVSTPLYFEIGRLAPENVVILGGVNALGADLDTLKPCSLDG
ncbi:cell wall-binding repeat-containing protein [Herbiconiux sp. VKM Ac-1786]|uniref:cell wall-binding repeat-containing protein n=1 Tax=Herbiconiux sp. VKM Ac-1786 TaxID=2783824 RepID=UPI00188C7942|nr:cell wall-binding repeat-containing protein [Herbiconiux sp. VKM Ac-1786]MBF4572786.1 cell wall-binding repeat-containing protein [Herbiconiux sp. VKM Ac-1786]